METHATDASAGQRPADGKRRWWFWFASSPTGVDQRAIYRAEKFIMLRTRYELMLARQGVPVPAPIAAMFARVPRMAPGSTVDAYVRLVKDLISWPDVDALEEAAIGALPADDIPAQLAMQRLTYSQTVPSAEYAQYEHTMLDLSALALPIPADLGERLRSDLLSVTQRIKYILQYGPQREQARNVLSARTVLLMVLGIIAIFALYVLSFKIIPIVSHDFVPTESLFLVLFAGLVGGFVSVQQRLQEPTNVDPLYKWLEFDASGASLVVSPIFGMVFAVALFAIILGGVVTGPLFPSFVGCANALAGSNAAEHCARHDFASFAYASTPDSPVSWAKLTVWAFAAGFLERLVPDILTRIAAVADK
jgi:hypothetical protein